MRVWEYLKDKWFALGVLGIAWFLETTFLMVMEVPVPVIATAEVIFAIGILILVLYDFLRKKRYYDELAKTFRELDEKSYLSQIIEEPSFLEGQILYEIVKQNGKYLNDVIARQEQEMLEYTEYVETWVHEVKTPIAVARLTIENNKNEVTRSLEEEIGKIENYVEQMLYYTKSSSLETDYRLRAVSLKNLCVSAVQKNAKMMVAQKVLPRFEDLDYEVLADAKWMEFILGQLITNSVKYRTKKQEPSITFSAEPEYSKKQGKPPAYVRFRVSDNGIGIPSQDLPRIFQKGFTGENGRMYKKSTGMGLYLCHNLCDKMGIELEIHSAEGEGTTVYFRMKTSCM